jgi:FlaA1/EpsC-like NDP-sugar epimerase
MIVIGFFDDDFSLWGKTISGLPIYDPSRVEDIIIKNKITDVILAVPSMSKFRQKTLLEKLIKLVRVRVLPSLLDLTSGKVTVNFLKDLEIEDLLGREPATPDNHLLEKNITNKTVMVTGAGGSIGSELCRQVIKFAPKKLVLIDASEFSLYSVTFEIEKLLEESVFSEIQIISLLANIKDQKRMSEIFSTWKPNTVFHAAAYKHVSIVEKNILEGVENNIFGTLVCATESLKNGVENFVLISTDKAVRPTNIMGASKRISEMILQALAKNIEEKFNRTNYCMVRFGNVLGSSGSVVPLFKRQINAGGPITLTDKRVTRFFMTIPEAAQLVIQSASMSEGGDVFVLDMGESVKLLDLAHKMIELSGLSVLDDNNPNGDIQIEIIGLRPGEKLYEELLIGNNPRPTQHPRIMRAHDDFLDRKSVV